jgi:2'-5' RNA ligase
MPQTIRSFIALELPAPIISLLDNVQQELKSLKLRARWVRTENIHLTLKFLGDIDTGDVDKIGEAICTAAEGFAPFLLALKGVGFFPGIKRPRVIWVGLDGQIQLLIQLQRKLADNLAAIGFPNEKRQFKGHLTLGRIREAANPHTIRQIIEEYSDLGSEEFTVGRVVLFQSGLKPTGAVYTGLRTISFK